VTIHPSAPLPLAGPAARGSLAHDATLWPPPTEPQRVVEVPAEAPIHAAVTPGATERCNGQDDDCDGTTDEPDAADATTWYADVDGDGWGDDLDTTVSCTAPSGFAADGGDCDDGDASVNPGAIDLCEDGYDDDCDGADAVCLPRGMYVDGFASILGDEAAEDDLLAYAVANDVEYLALYELHLVLSDLAALDAFVEKAKVTYGILEIGACGENEWFFDQMAAYNSAAAFPLDVFNLEYEYWNHSPRDFEDYLDVLDHMVALAALDPVVVETYLGWPTAAEVADIALLADRVLLHAYVASPETAWSYVEQRLGWFAAEPDPPELRVLLSGESAYMGSWLAAHSMDEAEATLLLDDSGDVVSGFQYFTYTVLP